MIVQKINLADTQTENGFMPYMETYLINHDGEKRPAVVICPGGGYTSCSEREEERIALNYNAAGFHAFVVEYCVAPHVFPMALKNVAKAISIVRTNADEWGVDVEKIIVCGFSAGGHLAASISTLWNDNNIFTKGEIESELHKPNASILCYPVITSGDYTHKGSIENLLGIQNENEDVRKKVSLEKRVNVGTPTAFIWHTFQDKEVPVENSMLYASALRKHNIPFELHVFDKGGHGLSLVTDETIWSKNRFQRAYPWHKLSVDWINSL